MYAPQDFMEFVSLLRTAATPADINNAWNTLEKPYNELRVITVLPEYHKNIILPGVDIRDLSGKRITTPYFLSDSLYFSSREIIQKTVTHGKIEIPIDGSIMLDTNIASYISTYINRRNFGKNQSEIVNLIHQLLEKNPNYDYIYYQIENSKSILNRYNQRSPSDAEELWEGLDKKLKDNLVALRLFLSIDKYKYLKSNCDTPTISLEEAENLAKNITYELYFGDNSPTLLGDINRRYTIARILLYKIVSINFESKEGVKKKAGKLLEFMIETLNTFFDREFQVAIKYFQEGRKFAFFEKLDKGKHIPTDVIRSKISNMSWDLMIPRLIESLSAVAGDGKFFIPHVLTWDKGLKMSLDLYKAKSCIFDDKRERVITITEIDTEKLVRETVGDLLAKHYFNPDAVFNRYKSGGPTDTELSEILSKVEDELFSAAHS